MNRILLILLLIIFAAAGCKKDEQPTTPTPIPKSDSTHYMKAKINGLPWTATKLKAEKQINNYKIISSDSTKTIEIIFYSPQIKTKLKFNTNGNAQLLIKNLIYDTLGFGGGEAEITDVSDSLITGTFSFYGNNVYGEKATISDGAFSIPLKK